MDYAQYKKLKEEIEADYQKKKDALEMLWSMYHKSVPAISFNISHHRPVGVSISDTLRKIIDGLSGNFTVNDILLGLKDYNLNGVNRFMVNNTLHRLMRRKELEVVEKGQGRTPSVYRKTQKKGNEL